MVCLAHKTINIVLARPIYIYTNIRSLRKSFNDLLVEINILKHKLHFIVLSEIRINSDAMNLYNIPGYNFL